MEAQARRARLQQGLRGLPRRDGAHRAADGHPREDHQGLRPRLELRRAQCHPPDEEADDRGPQGPARRAAHPDLRRGAREGPVPAALLPPGRGRRGDPVPQGAPGEARWWPARAAGEVPDPRAPRAGEVRPAGQGVGQAGDRHDDGLGPAAQGPYAGEGVRRADRADHPRRGADLRHGLLLPQQEDLQPPRAELHLGRRRPHAPTRSPSRGRSSTPASTRRARWRPSPRRRRAMPRTASR